MPRFHALTALALLVASLCAPGASSAQTLAYQQPSAAMREVLDAPVLPQTSLSPDQRWMAIVTPRRHRPVAEQARPVTRLAGLRLDAAARGPALITPIEALRLMPATGGAEVTVPLPPGGGFHGLRWSPDGARLLLQRRTDAGTELWTAEVARPSLRRVAGVRLNHVLDNDPAWLGPHELVVLTVPERLGPAPSAGAPTGPTVQESMGKTSPERTLQNLLSNPQDEALFTHLATSQMLRVNLKTGSVRPIGAPGLYSRVQTVGAATALLTERLVPPFSYQVAWNDFATQVAVTDLNGKPLRELARVPLKEGVPVEGVVTGPRQFWASPLADGALYWVEALDGGNPNTKVPHRDRLMRLDAPYSGEARELHKTAGRLMGLSFSESASRAMVTEFDRDRVWITADWLALDGSALPLRWQDRSLRDRYRDPGQPQMRVLPGNGRAVVRQDQGSLLLTGAGASPGGDRPFLDRFDLATQKTTRLFQASETHFEQAVALLPGGQLLTRRETFAEPPNWVLRSGEGFADMKPLTANADPTPSLRGIQRERIQFKRPDGVQLSFWLYLPPGHKGKNAGDARATFVWAYPQEFTDAATASQVSGSTSRFNTFGSTNPLMLLLDGYVVLMDATMPVVGDPKTVNDSFIDQITANAQAIIDKAVELGVSERDKMVVGGHSYGAFMTANLLAHTDLFKAGIARSGAYNRTLTPFGFQAERRTLWEAPNSYLKLSPFLVADKLREPLLLMHGEVDDNPGTFPLQSQRLYQALAGTGGNVRFVSLPFEGHGYTARESQGHVLWEMSEWMKRHTGGVPAQP
ncbi:MAG: prolyl oligopeptidase family serine peptidase [Inhella sp.]|uniref:S9 family peptidase n=1 Tax=Inhella sp. TaxID=1921806 RepID=UPI00391EF44D